MQTPDIHSTETHATVITEWIEAANAFDLDRYLSFFTDDAIFDDPSVGRAFPGRSGIAEYFTSYFVGYDTRTRLVALEARGEEVHVDVEFTGTFPGGRIGGTFDLTFAGDRIEHVLADLSH